jgi:hypothetical protein
MDLGVSGEGPEFICDQPGHRIFFNNGGHFHEGAG